MRNPRIHLPWLFAVTGVLAGFIVLCWLFLPPRERISGVVVQDPWMRVDPARGQGSPVPFADRNDPDSLYLIFLHGDGRALRIRLASRKAASIPFRDEAQVTSGRIVQYDLGGPHLFNVTPLKWQFTGSTEVRKVYHLFGFPWPNAPVTREARLRKGEWVLTDTRNGHVVEVLRIQVRDSERNENGFGELYVSLDGHWLVYVDASFSSKVYVFRRDPPNP